jgi:hypothetical protein
MSCYHQLTKIHWERRLFEKQSKQHMKPLGAPPLHPSMRGCPDFFKMSLGQTLGMLRKGPKGERNFQAPIERGQDIIVPQPTIPYNSKGVDAPEGYFDDMDDETLSLNANSAEQEDRVDFSSTQVSPFCIHKTIWLLALCSCMVFAKLWPAPSPPSYSESSQIVPAKPLTT